MFNESSREIGGVLDESLGILKKAREEVLQEVRKRLNEGKRRAESTKVQRISSAELRAKWSKVQLLDEFVNQVLNESLTKIGELKSRAQYRVTLSNLAIEGLKALDTRSAVLAGRKEDVNLLKGVAKELSGKGYSITVSGEAIQTVGGVKVLLEDGSITYDNTFEARLERIKPQLRRELYALAGE